MDNVLQQERYRRVSAASANQQERRAHAEGQPLLATLNLHRSPSTVPWASSAEGATAF
jgi:hypothetical protein